MSHIELTSDISRNEHVEDALRGMIDACNKRDRLAYTDHLADLVMTPGDGTYPSYEVAIFAKAVARLQDGADAKDVVNSTFLRVTQAALRTFEAGGRVDVGHLDLAKLLDSPAPAAAVGAYLAQIGSNLTVDRLRARAREADLVAHIGSNLPAPVDQVELSELDHALGRLGQAQRAVLHLVYTEGTSQTKVAEILGVSRPTVHNRLAAAVDALRVLMGD